MNKRLGAPAALIILMLVATGCTGPARSHGGEAATTPGVTATTVTIGSHQPLTGPASAGYSEIPRASKAYFDYVNAHGGVNGREIFYEYLDDAYNPANTPVLVRKLVEQDKVFAIFNGFGTPTHQQVVDYLNAQKVPDLFPGSGCTCWNDPVKLPYTFGYTTDYRREGKILGSYVAKSFPGKRIAYFYQNDAFGQQGVQGLDSEIPASQVVIRQSYQLGYNNITPQAEAIANAKSDVIVCFSIAAYTALLRLAQQKIGNTARLVVYQGGSDPATLSSLLPSTALSGNTQGNPLIQGIITDAWLTPLSDTSSSWSLLIKKIHDTYLPTLPLDQYVEIGVASAYTFVQALQQAGRNLTRQALVAAVERGQLSPGFGLTPFDYSQTSHGGYTGTQIGVIKGNVIVLQGPPLTTDDGTGPVVPYTAPQAPAPADGIPGP
ncbi:ABC transporter substrate-binding protein [Streptacidiphilus rugosus]|uniref:ABC transporter substrate-binding protein n=1 Tax=Streptacidiphilus rugosus TaxID=405783 RepID=UPI00056B33A2|nr:ABC transporter substrate-binding protein [Streptacidiphilus rugosus]